MKHTHFDIDANGFYGAYWECKCGADCAIIAMPGDAPRAILFGRALCREKRTAARNDR